MKRLLLALTLSWFFSLGKAQASIDLHSHLLMNEGMGSLMRASFDERPKAHSWNTRHRTRITSENLNASGLRIVVVSLYAHPMIRWGSQFQNSIRKQIERLEGYVRDHPEWIIASRASEAREALKNGKRVFILSLETASGTLDTVESRNYFIGEKKISIVTPFHLTPDRNGSPALYHKLGVLNSPFEWLRSWLKKNRDSNRVYINLNGMSLEGRDLIRDLVMRNVWIDLSHAPDQTQEDLQELLVNQPPLYTHTTPRKYFPSERGISEIQIRRVAEKKGIIGLIPSEDMHDPLLVEKPHTKTFCRSGVVVLAKIWKELAHIVGPERVMLGTDFNSPLVGVSPECSDHPEFKINGLREASLLPVFMNELKKNGAPIEPRSLVQEEAFLEAWSKVRP